ncbi:MAG: hypothetical protein IPM88_20890 [Nitrospira sp.]|nr:hypothetical protein [Nitrospira sp.]
MKLYPGRRVRRPPVTILGAIFWLGKTDYRGITISHYVYTRESVAGLGVRSFP